MYGALVEANDHETLMACRSLQIDDEGIDSPSEFGVTAAYRAIVSDCPDVLRALASRGIDLGACCDGMRFATPAFYAVKVPDRTHLITTLWELDVDLRLACTKSTSKYCDASPSYYAQLLYGKASREADFVHELAWRKHNASAHIQRRARGMLVRTRTDRDLVERRAAIVIQALVLGENVRIGRGSKSTVTVRTARRRGGAVRIQALVRGELCRAALD